MNTITVEQALAEFIYVEATTKAEDPGDFLSVMKAVFNLKTDEFCPLSRLAEGQKSKVVERVRRIAKDLLTSRK